MATHRRQTLDSVTGYMRSRNVPSFFQRIIVDFYEHMWSTPSKASVVFQELPDSLQSRLTMVMNRDLVERMAIFRLMPATVYIRMVQRLVHNTFLPGEYVIKRGSVATEMYFIKRGKCDALASDGVSIISTHLPGQFFGEHALLYRCRQPTSFRAVDFLDVWAMAKGDFDELQISAPVRSPCSLVAVAMPSIFVVTLLFFSAVVWLGQLFCAEIQRVDMQRQRLKLKYLVDQKKGKAQPKGEHRPTVKTFPTGRLSVSDEGDAVMHTPGVTKHRRASFLDRAKLKFGMSGRQDSSESTQKRRRSTMGSQTSEASAGTVRRFRDWLQSSRQSKEVDDTPPDGRRGRRASAPALASGGTERFNLKLRRSSAVHPHEGPALSAFRGDSENSVAFDRLSRTDTSVSSDAQGNAARMQSGNGGDGPGDREDQLQRYDVHTVHEALSESESDAPQTHRSRVSGESKAPPQTRFLPKMPSGRSPAHGFVPGQAPGESGLRHTPSFWKAPLPPLGGTLGGSASAEDGIGALVDDGDAAFDTTGPLAPAQVQNAQDLVSSWDDFGGGGGVVDRPLDVAEAFEQLMTEDLDAEDDAATAVSCPTPAVSPSEPDVVEM